MRARVIAEKSHRGGGHMHESCPKYVRTTDQGRRERPLRLPALFAGPGDLAGSMSNPPDAAHWCAIIRHNARGLGPGLRYG